MELLKAVRPLCVNEIVRGQFTAGVVDGHEAPGYRDEEQVRHAPGPASAPASPRVPERIRSATIAIDAEPAFPVAPRAIAGGMYGTHGLMLGA